MTRAGCAIALIALASPVEAQPVRDSTAAREAAPESPTPADPWLGRDKALHAGASLALTLGGTAVLTEAAGLDADRALPVAAGTALALGVMKELTDRRRDRSPLFSWRDLVADAVGVGLAAALVAGL